MTTTLILGALLSIIQIVGLILLIMVLIQQFKHGGVLNGVIGIITFGFWTFIWGWIKHKNLELSKIMVLWTIMTITPLVLTAVFGFAMMNEMVNMVVSLSEEGSFDKIKEGFEKNSGNKSVKLKLQAQKNEAKLPKTDSQEIAAHKDVDWSKKALALWKNGEYTDPHQAVDYWNKAVGNDPKSAETYNNRGLAYYNLKQPLQAIKDYSQAIHLKSEFAEAYNNRGNAYYELNQYELAEADFNQSLRFKSDYANAFLNRGLVYYQMGKNDEACQDFNKACDLGNCEGKQWAQQNGICRQ